MILCKSTHGINILTMQIPLIDSHCSHHSLDETILCLIEHDQAIQHLHHGCRASQPKQTIKAIKHCTIFNEVYQMTERGWGLNTWWVTQEPNGNHKQTWLVAKHPHCAHSFSTWNQQWKPWGGHSIVKLNTMCKQKKIYFFTQSITKMGQEIYHFFSWVEIHGIYHIKKNDNQI